MLSERERENFCFLFKIYVVTLKMHFCFKPLKCTVCLRGQCLWSHSFVAALTLPALICENQSNVHKCLEVLQPIVLL